MAPRSTFWTAAVAVPGSGLPFALEPAIPMALLGLPPQPQPEHVSPGFFGLLGPIVLTLVIAFVIELRLLPLHGPAGEVAEAEADRRSGLLGFAAGGVVGACCALGGVLAAQAADGEYLHGPVLVRLLLGPALAGTLILSIMVVAEAGLPNGVVAGVKEARRSLGRLRRAIQRVAAVALATVVGLLTLLFALLAGLIGGWWLWGAGAVYLWLAADSFANPSSTPVDPERLVRPRTFAGLLGLGVSVIAAASVTLPAPAAGSGRATVLYGFAASVLAALIVAFASGHPAARRAPVTIDQAARWTAAAAVGTIGLYAALLGAAGTVGSFPFWGTAGGLVALVAGIAAYWRPFD